MTKAEKLLEIVDKPASYTDIFPVSVKNGEVTDANGNTLLLANREFGTTPLIPVMRDALIHFVADFLNKNKDKYAKYVAEYRK